MLLLLVASSLAQGCYERQLNDDEVREIMVDSVVSGRHTRDNYSFTRHYRSDGTFEQVEGPRPRPLRSGSTPVPPRYTGTWLIIGDQFCIKWSRGHPKGNRDFCRRVMTDDDGNFWKEFDKRNGDTVKVVDYSSIRGMDNGNRLTRPSSSEKRRRWMATWRGKLVYILGALFVLWLLRKLLRGKDDASSLRNRIRRRLFGLKAGQYSYSFSEFKRLKSEELIDFVNASIAYRRALETEWAIEALLGREPDPMKAVGNLWAAVKSAPDLEVQGLLEQVREIFPNASEGIAAVDGDVRFAFLMGRSHSEVATLAQSISESRFEDNKRLALEYWKHVREHKPGPPPELAARAPSYRENAYRFADEPDYSNAVGAAFEAMMYMNFKPPPKPSRSSSYSSSSSSGGG